MKKEPLHCTLKNGHQTQTSFVPEQAADDWPTFKASLLWSAKLDDSASQQDDFLDGASGAACQTPGDIPEPPGLQDPEQRDSLDADTDSGRQEGSRPLCVHSPGPRAPVTFQTGLRAP